MLSSGARLGPYEVSGPLGAGGMGEVYRARDTRLKRDVALKILPVSFATDAERLARFQREAEVLASLSHPHVAGIYGLEESDGMRALVLELVEGETLHQRIARGAIPVPEALTQARQIAAALDVAHQRGIVHRDLKPANIKITPDGTVKVLDFGLAKLAERDDSRGEGGESVPITALSLPGAVMGTAAYMSPEQARGDEVDQRSDIWAFGCVLFEMLTGRRAFAGRGTTETLAHVLTATPDWSLLPSDVPSAIRQLLRRCLEKDREQRLPEMSAASRVITDTELDTRKGRTGRLEPTSLLPWIGGLAIAIAAVILLVRSPWTQTPEGGGSAVSVAVLPFASFSEGREDEYFADGLTEEVIHSLAQVPGLNVAARTSAFYFKGRDEDLREVGRRLGVSHVVEGSVRRDGNRMRMVAQLIKVDDGFHLWSRTYERNVSDAFAVQTEIATAVAEALQLKLALSPDRPRERDPEAVNMELTARAMLRRLGREEITTARDRFRRLTELEQNNASAWAGFAHATILLMQNYGALSFEDATAQASSAVDRALKLDPNNADGWLARGWLDYMIYFRGGDERRAATADAAFRRALELDPRNPDVLIYHAALLNEQGRTNDAVTKARRALEIDPLNRLAKLMYAAGLSSQGKKDEAEAQYHSIIELYPDFPDPKVSLGNLLMARGRLAEAEPWLRAAVDEQDPTTVLPLIVLYVNLGMREDADRVAGSLDSTDIGKRVHAAIPLVLDRRDREVIAFADAELAKGEDPLWHSTAMTAAVLSGDWKRVRREIAYAAPGLLLPEPAVDLDRLTEALSAAALFEAEGDRAQRNRILRAVLATAAPRPGVDDGNEARTARVKAYAALGDKESALKELQAAVDAGYRTLWDDDLIRFERDPNLATIRNDQAFMAIIFRVEEDLRRQREQVLKSRR
jgi:serine/threonine protein kinase/Tfp pilus assembly protein PilF